MGPISIIFCMTRLGIDPTTYQSQGGPVAEWSSLSLSMTWHKILSSLHLDIEEMDAERYHWVVEFASEFFFSYILQIKETSVCAVRKELLSAWRQSKNTRIPEHSITLSACRGTECVRGNCQWAYWVIYSFNKL